MSGLGIIKANGSESESRAGVRILTGGHVSEMVLVDMLIKVEPRDY